MFEDFRKRDGRGDTQRQHPFGASMQEERPMDLFLLGRRIGKLRGDDAVLKENIEISQADQRGLFVRRFPLGQQGVSRPLDLMRPALKREGAKEQKKTERRHPDESRGPVHRHWAGSRLSPG